MTQTASPTQIRLGSSELEISRVGFGAWAISGGEWSYGWGVQDDAESIAAIHEAVAGGVNWVDTAAVYGLGHSEEVVGRALAALPQADRPLVFTKCGLVWDPSDHLAPARKMMRPDSVRRELDASLRRLGVDQIDLYQVHWPGDGLLLSGVGASESGSGDLATPLEEYWQLMADLRREGKVRHIGLSNHDVAQLEIAESIAHIDAIQPPFSALHRSAAAEITWAERHRVGVITYSPMASGLLTGAFSADRVAGLPANDWRRSHPDFTDGLAANLAVTDALRPIAARHQVPVAAAAVAWVLGWPGIDAAIVGARRPGQAVDWLPAADLELTAADLDTIATAIEHHGAGDGPAHPGDVSR